MRRAAVAGLLAAAACNQVFGIDKADPRDAPIAPKGHDVLVTEMWSDAIDLAAPTLKFPAIPTDQNPSISLARLDDGFVASVPEADGTVHVPAEIFGTDGTAAATWRLQVRRKDRVPLEVQWKPMATSTPTAPDASSGHFVVSSQFGHADIATPVPAGAGFAITPAGATTHVNTHVFTTGVWTDTLVGNLSGPEIDLAFGAPLTLLSGRFVATQPGDFGLAFDYAAAMGCRSSSGGTSFALPALATSFSPVSASWATTPLLAETYSLSFDVTARLSTVLGALAEDTPIGHVQFGKISDERMPSFLHQGVNLGDLPLPVPVMITLVDCPLSATSLPNHFEGTMPPGLSNVMHAQISVSRTLPGTSLHLPSGIETTAGPRQGSQTDYVLDMPVAMPSGISIASGATTLDLSPMNGTDDAQTLALGGAATVTIVPETDASLHTDYYEVTLVRVDGDVATPTHVYISAQPSIAMDASELASGREYLLLVRAFRGFPGASIGDFTMVTYPQSAASIYSRPFRIP